MTIAWEQASKISFMLLSASKESAERMQAISKVVSEICGSVKCMPGNAQSKQEIAGEFAEALHFLHMTYVRFLADLDRHEAGMDEVRKRVADLIR